MKISEELFSKQSEQQRLSGKISVQQFRFLYLVREHYFRTMIIVILLSTCEFKLKGSYDCKPNEPCATFQAFTENGVQSTVSYK